MQRDDFEGCAFVTSLLEFEDRSDPVRQACVTHLATIRAFVCELATDAGVADPERFAAQWHILMKGSIVAAHEGDRDAAMKARELGALLLERDGVALPALTLRETLPAGYGAANLAQALAAALTEAGSRRR